VAGQQRLYGGPLDSLAPAVDQSDLAKPPPTRLREVLVDHRGPVAGMKRVKVQRVFDRQDDRLVLGTV
jgi:hypothetical protein